MAKRKAARRARPAKPARKAAPKRRSAKRPTPKSAAKRRLKPKAKAPKKAAARKTSQKGLKKSPKKSAVSVRKAPAAKAAKARPARKPAAPAGKLPRLDRVRRTLDEVEPHTTPPSSLDMNQRGSAARSGRAEMEQKERNTRGMSSDITGGDVDVDVEDAYFTGDEAPGGDNPSPDLEVVDDIGKALGVTYNDAEELKSGDKLVERDKHRWEMDPASSEDYKDRD
jgi:hypothetical protein